MSAPRLFEATARVVPPGAARRILGTSKSSHMAFEEGAVEMRKAVVAAVIVIAIVLAALVAGVALSRVNAPAVLPPHRPPGFNPGGPRVPVQQGTTPTAAVMRPQASRMATGPRDRVLT